MVKTNYCVETSGLQEVTDPTTIGSCFNLEGQSHVGVVQPSRKVKGGPGFLSDFGQKVYPTSRTDKTPGCSSL